MRKAARILAFSGPSGAGKSTLLAVIAGLIAPDAGTVEPADRASGTGIVLGLAAFGGYLFWQGRQEAAKEAQSEALIQAMDIVPWLLTQARANLPEGMEAVSIEPVFKNPEWPGREAVFCEQGRDNILTDVEFMTMVRTKQWKLVHFLNEEFGQLFDLQNDPEEENNPKNMEIIKVFASQALFLYSYTHNND